MFNHDETVYTRKHFDYGVSFMFIKVVGGFQRKYGVGFGREKLRTEVLCPQRTTIKELNLSI